MNAKQKAAKKKYMREYMRKYYHDKIKPKLDAQKSKAMKKIEYGNIVTFPCKGKVKKGQLLVLSKDKLTVQPMKRSPQTPQLPQHKPEENPCCPHCGTLRVWKLECPQCFRDPKNPHKPPSPKQSRVHIIEDGQPVDGESD